MVMMDGRRPLTNLGCMNTACGPTSNDDPFDSCHLCYASEQNFSVNEAVACCMHASFAPKESISKA